MPSDPPTDIASHETVGEAKEDDRLEMVAGRTSGQLSDRFDCTLPVWFVSKGDDAFRATIYGATARSDDAPLTRFQ